ncbi:MAG TPA: hypothetical protein VFY70_04785 [Thermomicrobiales bacterium]|nr:hypothetical protein [Thermomicrobiales bacterium]
MKADNTRSPRLPGGDLVSALFDREVMGFADRGGASNLIGDRWADIAAGHVATWIGTEKRLHADDHELLRIVRVDRLDATPAIAAAASKRGLQNPDLLLIGQRGDQQAVQAADAKFSVETARSKQVSPEVVLGLLELRKHVPGILDGVGDRVRIESGVFLCPDYPLTHLMLRHRRGIMRATVRREEVVLVPAAANRFWDGVPGAELIAPLASTDNLTVRPDESLMAGVYYFRLARAAVGFWLDATKPLLLHNDVVAIDISAVREEAVRRSRSAASAIDLIRRWDADVQTIRHQRAAVDQVAGLPIPGRELRPMATRIAQAVGADPPSANQVRRRLGAWYRGVLRDRFGPIPPPVSDLPSILRQLSDAGRDLGPQAERELERIVLELVEVNTSGAPLVGSDVTDG